MTLPDQVLGFGSSLQVDRGAGFTTIARLTEIGEFRPTRPDVDVTTHQSTGGHMEFRPGLIDPGEISFSGVWTADASQTALMDDVLAGVETDNVYSYRVVLPRGLGTFTCDGYLKEVGLNPQMDGRLEFSGALKWTGPAEFVVTESAGQTTPVQTTSNSGVITPAASGAVTDYVITYLTGVTSVTLTPTAAAGVIRVNGNIVASGAPSSAIALGGAGSLTTVTITVKETDKVAKEYTVRLLRA
jgi:hypothetical protein